MSYQRILLVNGPNLNLLGIRQPEIYGSVTLAEIEENVVREGAALGYTVECFQSNSEGALIDAIQSAYGRADGILLNAGAYTHYSYAIRDAIASVRVPTMEIHLSDIHARESFRNVSVICEVCAEQICGLGAEGYLVALRKLVRDYV